MSLYDKLKKQNLVEDHKEFVELIRMRAIKINEIEIDDPTHELNENDNNIKIGILSIE